LINPSHITALKDLIESSSVILVMQPDNPDGDSLGSALALEEILGDLGKTVVLYSYNAPSEYLRMLEGWDRVTEHFPKHFDCVIIVDSGTPDMLRATFEHYGEGIVGKPLVVIDHHTTTESFGDHTLSIVTPAAATSELLVELAQALNWPVNERAAAKLATAILSDSLNLTASYTTATTVEALAFCVRAGANLAELYRIKRESGALEQRNLILKGELLARVEFLCDGRMAWCLIPNEIAKKSKDDHNPTDLIIWDMIWAKDVVVAIVVKDYGSKLKVALKSRGSMAGAIAEKIGGGGHASASGARLDDISVEDAQNKIIAAFHEAIREQV
jgi:phosphoesterase RecJ-like protein